MWQIVTLGLIILIAYGQEEARQREMAPPPAPSAPKRPATRPVYEEVIMESISGKLYDNKENALKNARLWIVDKPTGKVLGETRTDDKGNYAIAVPKVDTVIVRASMEGKDFLERVYPFEVLLREGDIQLER